MTGHKTERCRSRGTVVQRVWFVVMDLQGQRKLSVTPSCIIARNKNCY